MTRKKNSKIVLGCVQFGTPYGIQNKKKIKPSKLEVKKILKYAKLNKINQLDNSEDYNFDLKNINKLSFKYSTKIRNLSINNSIKYYCIYIHDGDKFLKNKDKKIYEYLKYLKKKKITKKIGISIYETRNIDIILKRYKFDIIQAPYSIFDRRIEKYFKILKKNKIKIYARSIFLQGLLLMPLKDIDNYFRKWKSNFELLEKFTKKKQISKLELCLSFVLKSKYIDKVIIGIQSLSQLKDIVSCEIKNKIIVPKFLKVYDKKLIYPFNWVLKKI